MYIYIYIYREREIHIYIYVYLYIKSDLSSDPSFCAMFVEARGGQSYTRGPFYTCVRIYIYI